jgi:tetratricopeptide (TPR) repeat protein
LEAEVIERAGGIPFYMEELTRAVVEQMSATEDDEPEVARIPISLHESLVARLDRLGAARRIANIGAVIGPQFEFELLAAVAGGPASQLRSAMGTLKRAGLVAQIGTGEAIAYRFRHALMRDAAYESMLRPDRRAWHQQVANALATKFPELCETEPETLAYHFAHGSTPASAIAPYVAAGRKAAARGGHREALAHYEAALRLIETTPEGLERLQAELGCLLPMQISLAAALGYASDEVQRALTRARDICGLMGDAAPLFPVLHALSKFWTVRGDQAEAEALSRDCARIAEESGVPLYTAYAAGMVGYVMNVTGRPAAEVIAVVRRGLATYEANEAACAEILSENNAKTALLGVLPIALGRMGDMAGAILAAQEAIAWARRLGRPFDLAFSLSFAAGLFLSLRDYRKTLETAREAADICQERGFAVWLQSAKAHVAMASAHLGDETARDALIAAMAAWRQMGCNSVRGFYIEHLALIEARRGRHAEALNLADEAIATDERFQDYGFLPGAFASRAQVRLMAPRPDYGLAEADMRRAIELARAQGSPGLEYVFAQGLEHFKAASGAVLP